MYYFNPARLAPVHRLFEHTADLGIRVEAKDLDELLAEAGRGLLSVIVEDPETIRPVLEVPLRVEGSDPAYLLFDWLSEILALFDTRHLLLCQFDVKVGAGGVEALARGEEADPGRHVLLHEVKAITYHGLRAEREGSGWVAEVIVDI